jgi:hypothetical protein
MPKLSKNLVPSQLAKNRTDKIPYCFKEIFERELAKIEDEATRFMYKVGREPIIILYNSQPEVKRRDILREILEKYAPAEPVQTRI